MIHVCSLARLHETVEATRASHIVTLISRDIEVERPPSIPATNHLWLEMHDISTPLDGYLLPQTHHIEELLTFVRQWNREQPMVVHCHAGISRSSAAAFVAACALAPHRDERTIAMAMREASPTALPNVRIVSLADQALARSGRMVAAIKAMSPYSPCFSGAAPFRVAID